jgi:endonuclease YncB( thermonuclease family)/Spy/CpxP family protein refolding chaperone
MFRSNSQSDQSTHFRRGTIMGLTIAESFMLITFALLLLLTLWRSAFIESADDAQQFYNQFSEQERRTLLEIVKDSNLRDLQDRARLVAEQDIRALAEAAQELPVEQRRALIDLVSLSDFDDTLEKINEYAELFEENPNAEEIKRALEVVRSENYLEELAQYSQFAERGISAAQLENALSVSGQLEFEIAKSAITEENVAREIRERTGDLVEKVGGTIEANGNVVLPDELLFHQGQDDLRPELEEFLTGFCRPWFEILYDYRDTLSAIQIEGHASSEWGIDPLDTAYLKNLVLSQTRARAVFARCLSLVGADEVGDWARRSMAAVGYSSSRPVVVGSQEDYERSRRVVFSIQTDSTEAIERLTQKLDQSSSREQTDLISFSENLRSAISAKDYQQMTGVVTHVRDGDTIEIGDAAIRLQGLHAPELSDPLGDQARELMQALVLGKEVDCMLDGTRNGGRVIGICFANGLDIAAQLVDRGLARDCAAFSGGRYLPFEIEDSKIMGMPGYCLN